MTGRTIIVIGLCMAGLLLNEISTGVVPVDATATSRIETATFALG